VVFARREELKITNCKLKIPSPTRRISGRKRNVEQSHCRSTPTHDALTGEKLLDPPRRATDLEWQRGFSIFNFQFGIPYPERGALGFA
jgi:hypothetical protein